MRASLDRLLIPLRLAHTVLRRDPGARRHLVRWLGSLRPGVNPLELGLPWLAFGAIEWLEANVRSSWRVLELGSGGSTRFFRGRVDELVSVEHQEPWFAKVRGVVPDGPGFTYLLEPAERFAEIVERYPEGYFDLVLIDGGADRVACLQSAAARARPGTFVMLDNADLEEPAAIALPFPCTEFSGVAPWNVHGGRVHLQTTALWRIPDVGRS